MTSPKIKVRLAVLVSNVSPGTDLRAIFETMGTGRLNNLEICAVVSDKSDAPGFESARKHNLKMVLCPAKGDLLEVLKKLNPDYIALAGWKQVILDEVILAFPNKILNLHPGLIPDTVDGVVKNPDGTDGLWNKGKMTAKAIQNFLDQKATFAGTSIHFLTLNFDFGPVLGRKFVKIKADDTVETLYSRVKKKENEMYVEVLEKLTSLPAPLLDKERVAKGRVRYEKILIIGAGGGREHSLGWKISQSPRAGKLFFARGNAGTATLGTNLEIKEIEIAKLLDFAKIEKINLTLALSDDPLALGIVDEFQKAGLRVWGPSKLAAEIEWSKAFSKDFMRRHDLPTARFEIFDDFEKAKDYVAKQPFPIVIKASGLALGKGVVICKTPEEAKETLENIMVKKIFGNSGNEVVIEEFLTGPEISIHAFSDGKSYKIFPPSQDHKKIGEGDTGPNTGGIGAISPLSFVDEKLFKKIEQNIVAPAIRGLASDGRPFVGILYPGLMLTPEGPKILEFNARFGDPEAEVYVRLMENDLLDVIDASIDGKLNEIEIKWKNIFACNIVLASGGYPGNYEKGKVIRGVEDAEKMPNIIVFHAGTKIVRQDLTTNGGRVLGISATGNSLEEALDKAYKAIEKISFEGMQYRKDIGKKALELEKLSK